MDKGLGIEDLNLCIKCMISELGDIIVDIVEDMEMYSLCIEKIMYCMLIIIQQLGDGYFWCSYYLMI